jgi:hypothetical protein
MKFSIALSLLLFSVLSSAAVLIRKIESPNRSQTLSTEIISKNVSGRKIIKKIPYFLSEGSDPSSIEYYVEEISEQNVSTVAPREMVNWPGSEVRVISEAGAAANRINLAFLGDGYTEEERDRFFNDVDYLVNDLFVAQTFKSYLNIFNIYAIFTPSKESGISDITKKNTVFGLYRTPKGSKRAIMPGNTLALERAIKLVPHTIHYPIVVANDDFYGGLGGRYAITTRSRTSGPIVLRHELGHNFGDVGEEYDGGNVYQGANSSSKNLSWKHWIDSKNIELHRAELLMGSYVWQDLKTPFENSFVLPKTIQSQGPFTYEVQMSSVFWNSSNDVNLTIDGKSYQYNGKFLNDRSFFDVYDLNLSEGQHNIRIENKADQDNILAFAYVYAYPSTYDKTPHKVMAYANYNEQEQFVGYRPTHNSCLMRNMTVPYFCAVDQENMWHQFFDRINLIDELNINLNKISLETLNLDLTITWYKKVGLKYVELSALKNMKDVDLDAGANYQVKVEFKTDEVRSYSKEFEEIRNFKL